MKGVAEMVTHKYSLLSYAIGIILTGGGFTLHQGVLAPGMDTLDTVMTSVQEELEYAVSLNEDMLIETMVTNELNHGKRKVDSLRDEVRKEYVAAKFWENR